MAPSKRFTIQVYLALALSVLAIRTDAWGANRRRRMAPPPRPHSSRAAPTETAPTPVTISPVPAPEISSNGTGSSGAPLRGPTRIDFDDRMIQGQTNRSGSVYLYDRKELKTSSMLRKRDNFRREIVDDFYGS